MNWWILLIVPLKISIHAIFLKLAMNAKVCNSIFTSVAYHDRMITMFGPLNHFSIEAAGLDPEGLKTVGAGGGGALTAEDMYQAV